jgi:hypothetical protein
MNRGNYDFKDMVMHNIFGTYRLYIIDDLVWREISPGHSSKCRCTNNVQNAYIDFLFLEENED